MLSKKRIASCQSRTLITMQEKILMMKEQWSGVDSKMQSQIESLEKMVNRCVTKLENERSR